MKRVIRWILIIWTIASIPFAFEELDLTEAFFAILYISLLLGIMISDLRLEYKKN